MATDSPICSSVARNPSTAEAPHSVSRYMTSNCGGASVAARSAAAETACGEAGA